MPKMPNDPATPMGKYTMISPTESTAEAAKGMKKSAVQAKMGFASTGSCVVALTNTILGSGMLGLPHAFSSCGYILGLFFLVLGGIMSSFGLHLLCCSANTLWRQEGSRTPTSFYKVAKFALPRWYLLIDLAVAIKCFGVGCSYLVVIGDLMPEAMEQLAPTFELFHNRTFWVIVGWGVVGPLSCMPTLDKLKVTNRLAIICVLLVAGLVVAYALATLGMIDGGLEPCDIEITDERTQCRGPTYLAVMNMDTVKTLTVYIFAFTCHQNIFSVCNEVRNFSLPKVNKVIGISIGSSGVIYIVVACAGYATYGPEVASDILVSYPQTKLLSAARVFISCLVAFSYPLQCLPSRNAATTLWAALDDSLSGGQTEEAMSRTVSGRDSGAFRASHPEVQAKLEMQKLRDENDSLRKSLAAKELQLAAALRGEALPEPEPEPEPESSAHAEEEGGEQAEEGGKASLGQELQSLTGEESVADVTASLAKERTARFRYLTLTTVFLVGTLTVALALSDLGVLLSIVGATGSTIVSYILPGAIYHSMHTGDRGWKRQAAGAMFLAGCGIIPMALSFIIFGGASH